MAQIAIPEANIRQFCIQNQIKKLALFGSVLRDDFRADSDIDIIVEFMPDTRVGMLTMADTYSSYARSRQGGSGIHD